MIYAPAGYTTEYLQTLNLCLRSGNVPFRKTGNDPGVFVGTPILYLYMYMYGFSLIFISQHFYFIYLLFSADILNHKLQDLTPEQVVGKKSMKHFQGIIVLFYIS